MTAIPKKLEPIYSTLADDPDLGQIVDLFVMEMPGRAASLRRHLSLSNWEELRRAAHQLKGAAGSYGFQPITPAAARVEDGVRRGLPEEQIRHAVDELVAMCESVRSGTAG